jgi:hypothetical protein
MPYLKTKSQTNEVAALLLHEKGLFVSVVHCSYYSCVQLMKHIVIHVLGIPETKIEADVSFNRGSSHAYLINKIVYHLKVKQKDWRDFNKDINDLKTLRNDADYSDTVEIDKVLSKKSIDLSGAVLKELKKL